MRYLTLIVLLMASIGLGYMAEFITRPTASEQAYAQVQQRLVELAKGEAASGVIKELAVDMQKARRLAGVSATFRHGFHVWSLIASVGALAAAFWITFDQPKPNKPLHGTPAKTPSSSTEPESRRP